MRKSHLKIVFGLVGLLAALFLFRSWESWWAANIRAKHIQVVARSSHIILPMLQGMERLDLAMHDVENWPNSWRSNLISVTPWLSGEDLPPGPTTSWQSEYWQEWADNTHYLFCQKKLLDFPREQRFTQIMTLQGAGCALEYLRLGKLKDLQKLSPDTIVLLEVKNSTVPWMEKGDLILNEFPKVINHPEELCIGSAHGYDQFVVGFADMTVWIIDSTVPFEVLEKFFTVEGARTHNREEILGLYGSVVETP